MPLESSPRILFPESGITGAKVRLQPFSLLDIDDRYLAWLNDPQVVRYSNQRFIRHNEASARAYLASFDATDNVFLSVRRSDSNRVIGTMTAYVARHHATADVGLMIGDKAVWGQGFGQDAWDTLLSWLFESANIRKITAGTLACNHGMKTVMQRSGMQHEATRRAQEIVNGESVDIVYYARFHDA